MNWKLLVMTKQHQRSDSRKIGAVLDVMVAGVQAGTAGDATAGTGREATGTGVSALAHAAHMV